MEIGERIKIISDGTPGGTKIYNSRGLVIENIMAIDWHIAGNSEIAEVKVELEPPIAELTGRIGEIVDHGRNELGFRQILWLRHGCPLSGLYGDDGEMQCHACGIDFLRDSPDKIGSRFTKIGIEKISQSYTRFLDIFVMGLGI